MQSRLKLKPGQKGTKRLLDIYGDSLVCVRYRYDTATRMRFKTVELIVEKKDWTPPPAKIKDATRVPVIIAFKETALKAMAKEAGGRWNPEEKLWFVPYGRIKGTPLERHIVLDAFSSEQQPESI